VIRVTFRITRELSTPIPDSRGSPLSSSVLVSVLRANKHETRFRDRPRYKSNVVDLVEILKKSIEENSGKAGTVSDGKKSKKASHGHSRTKLKKAA